MRSTEEQSATGWTRDGECDGTRANMAISSCSLAWCVGLFACLGPAAIAIATPAIAQTAPTGAPPPDATALVAAPKDPLTLPVVKKLRNGATDGSEGTANGDV